MSSFRLQLYLRACSVKLCHDLLIRMVPETFCNGYILLNIIERRKGQECAFVFILLNRGLAIIHKQQQEHQNFTFLSICQRKAINKTNITLLYAMQLLQCTITGFNLTEPVQNRQDLVQTEGFAVTLCKHSDGFYIPETV